MLSYVEFYRPKFFLLENLLGLLIHKLQVNKAGLQEGNIVTHSIVKYILRTLTSLGYVHHSLPVQKQSFRSKHYDHRGFTYGELLNSYQERFSILQAGAYGSPQLPLREPSKMPWNSAEKMVWKANQ